jgi:phosphosulfolactate synthase (CoM biosynthesis protein A)
MIHIERIADFATRASFDSLSTRARDQTKIRILDSLGCALGALQGEPIRQIRDESEGITENVKTWRTDVPARIIDELGLEKVIFEAADPDVFAWYIKNYGPEVNLFVDHSQIVQLECLRRGIWGTASLWGRVVTNKDRKADHGI